MLFLLFLQYINQWFLTPSQPCQLYQHQSETHFVVVETSHNGQHMNLLTDERCSKITSLWKPAMTMSEQVAEDSRHCQTTRRASSEEMVPRDKRPGNTALKTKVRIVKGKGTKRIQVWPDDTALEIKMSTVREQGTYRRYVWPNDTVLKTKTSSVRRHGTNRC